MPSINDSVIVITGASSGIGAAFAELVGKKGARVLLVARREKELAKVALRTSAGALVVVGDVTRRPDVERALAVAIERFGHVDVWINNAGRGITRNVSELTDDDVDAMIQVNLKSVLYGMQAVLPHFKQRRRGHIINVSSVLGRVPLAPWRSAYLAAKHAANGLTASLRMELSGTFPEIHVTAVHPGVVATDFGTSALHGGDDSRTAVANPQSPEEVAEVIASAVESPRADVYTRSVYKDLVASYYAADDMAVWEEKSRIRR